MIESLILIEGNDVKEENLGISLGNAKQLVVGRAVGFGIILHLAVDSPAYFSDALRDLSQVVGVTGVITLAVRSQP